MEMTLMPKADYGKVKTGLQQDDEEMAIVESMAAVQLRRYTFSAKAPTNSPTVLSWKDLSVSTKTTPSKELLKNLSGSITGGFWAIMGASGSGKTTLLSTLSLRLDSRFMNIDGEFTMNGRSYSKGDLKAMTVYVMQDDVLHSELTCEETLYYASQLRLPQTFTDEERKLRVAEVLCLMGIDHCRNTLVGDSRRKGISGGERKRLCIAMELLSKPKLVFLDEPTSGLDSTTSLDLITSLKRLTDAGECTVICTIHQPQQRIFEMFDNLILMKRGEIVYLGSCQKSLLFLESLNVTLEPGVNPADKLIEVVSPTNQEMAELLTSKVAVPVDLSMGLEKEFFSNRQGATWLRQFLVLARRNFLQYIRNYDIILMNLAASLLIAVFVGSGIWHNQQNNQTGAATMPPSLFFGCVTQGVYASLQCVNSFPRERAVMMRERAAGAYYTSSYYMAKTLVDIVTGVWSPILFSAVVYPLLNYQHSTKKWFIYTCFMILDSLAATSIATSVSCIFVTVERSTVVLSFLFEVCRLYGGFFTSPEQLTAFPDWQFADAISFIKYAFVGVALNQLEDLEFTCTAKQVAAKTCIQTGEKIIMTKGYDEYSISWLAGMLVAYIIIVRVVGYIALRFVKSG